MSRQEQEGRVRDGVSYLSTLFLLLLPRSVSELPVGTETTGETVPIVPRAASSLFGGHFMEPAPVSEYGTPVPVVENIAPQSAYRFVPEDDTGLVNPQFFDSTVEALAPRMMGSLPLMPESAVSCAAEIPLVGQSTPFFCCCWYKHGTCSSR